MPLPEVRLISPEEEKQRLSGTEAFNDRNHFPPHDQFASTHKPVEEPPGDIYPSEVFESMKRDILLGNLSVKVYNKDLMTQPKWLAINRMANRILLLGENRL